MIMRNLLLTAILLLSGTSSSLANQQPKSFATIPKDPLTSASDTAEALLAPINESIEAANTEALLATEPAAKPARGNAKLANLVERTTSAVVVLALLTVLIRKTGAKGMKGLVLAAQIGMFGECTTISQVTSTLSKVLALATHMVAWDAPYLLNVKNPELIPLVAFGIFVLHIIVLVLQQNASKEETFGPVLRDFGISQLAAAIVVGLSSTWLGTLTQFGSLAWIFFPALLVIVNDTMAYICGILIGNHKLLPTVSPKKTWEGFLGAAAFTVALSKPLWKLIMKDTATIAPKQLYLLAAYVSLIAPFGGFLASTTKRTFGAKDFGAIMPGHGGLVDRLDCQLITAPFVFLYLSYLGGPKGLAAAAASF